jgi:hypothetical protein
MAIIIVFLVREFIFLIQKDPDYWLFTRTNQAYMKYWNYLENAQPKQNTAIIQSNGKRKKSKQ